MLKISEQRHVARMRHVAFFMHMKAKPFSRRGRDSLARGEVWRQEGMSAGIMFWLAHKLLLEQGKPTIHNKEEDEG